MLHPDMWNKEGQLAWRWHPAELLEEGSNSLQEAGSQLGEKKTGLLPAPYVGRVDLQQARTIPLHLSK